MVQIVKFNWKNKKAKISLSTIQKNKCIGGLEAPNFLHYYLANQIQDIIKWVHPNAANNSWIELEQITVLISSTFTAWWKTLEITNSLTEPCSLSPIWHSSDFQINRRTLQFRTCEQKGIFIRSSKIIRSCQPLICFKDLD